MTVRASISTEDRRASVSLRDTDARVGVSLANVPRGALRALAALLLVSADSADAGDMELDFPACSTLTLTR